MRNLNLVLVVLMGLTGSVMTLPVENKNEQVAANNPNEVEDRFDSSNAVYDASENTDNSDNGNIEKVTGLNAAGEVRKNSDNEECDGGDDDNYDNYDDDDNEYNEDGGYDDGDNEDYGDEDEDGNDEYFEEQNVDSETVEPQYVDDGEFPTMQSEDMEAAVEDVDQGSKEIKSAENEDPETETGSRQAVDWPDFWCEKECRETYLLYEGCKRQGELIGESCVCSAHFRYKMDKCRADGCGHYYDRSPDWQKLMEKYEEECRDKGDDFVDY